MSKLGQLKKKVGFEGNVPRCANCRHYREAKVLLSTNSNTYRKNQHCALHNFTITANSLCDTWHGTDGGSLTDDSLLGRLQKGRAACPR